MIRKAIVFDSSGTLVEVFRVLKDLDSNQFIYDESSTYMVSRKDACALIAIDEDINWILSQDDERFISSSDLEFKVSCYSLKIIEDEIYNALKRAKRAKFADIKKLIGKVYPIHKKIYYINVGLIIDTSRSENTIRFLLGSSGKIFKNVFPLFDSLKKDFDIYIATGDTRRSAIALAKILNIDDDRIFSLATPVIKEKIILELKKEYDTVIMVGDGINDLLAFRAADLSILTRQQDQKVPEILTKSVDHIVLDLLQIPKIVEIYEKK
jgi:Cu+-exporting ATPase